MVSCLSLPYYWRCDSYIFLLSTWLFKAVTLQRLLVSLLGCLWWLWPSHHNWNSFSALFPYLTNWGCDSARFLVSPGSRSRSYSSNNCITDRSLVQNQVYDWLFTSKHQNFPCFIFLIHSRNTLLVYNNLWQGYYNLWQGYYNLWQGYYRSFMTIWLPCDQQEVVSHWQSTLEASIVFIVWTTGNSQGPWKDTHIVLLLTTPSTCIDSLPPGWKLLPLSLSCVWLPLQ